MNWERGEGLHDPNEAPIGACVWLTGRSGGGKSTLVRALLPLLEETGRTTSVLDVMPLFARQPLERSSEGKLLRKAAIAAEIAKHGGLAICVTVSARRDVRRRAREIVSPYRFVEVLVDVPAEVALGRKAARSNTPSLRKRLRRAVRRLKNKILGSADGYEAPAHPDLVLDSVALTPEENARVLFEYLVTEGIVVPALAM